MGAQMKKLLALLLVLTLMSPSLAAVAEAVLELPASLQIIDEEAFYQATAIDEVVVRREPPKFVRKPLLTAAFNRSRCRSPWNTSRTTPSKAAKI